MMTTNFTHFPPSSTFHTYCYKLQHYRWRTLSIFIPVLIITKIDIRKGYVCLMFSSRMLIEWLIVSCLSISCTPLPAAIPLSSTVSDSVCHITKDYFHLLYSGQGWETKQFSAGKYCRNLYPCY